MVYLVSHYLRYKSSYQDFFQERLLQITTMCSNIDSLIFNNTEVDLAIFTREKLKTYSENVLHVYPATFCNRYMNYC